MADDRRRWLPVGEFAALASASPNHWGGATSDGQPLAPVDRAGLPHAVASVLVATHDGHVLLGRNKSGGWGTVGGHIEREDASIAGAAVRELAEECRLILDAGLLRPISVAIDEGEFRPGCQHIDFCFAVMLPWAPDVSAGSDLEGVQWFELSDLPELNAHMQAHVSALAGAPLGPDARATLRRRAARAVVRRDGQLLLMRSGRHGDVKFPGGGLESAETIEEALARELREETGRTLHSVSPPLVTVMQARPDVDDPDVLFAMESTYLGCRVGDEAAAIELTTEEREIDLAPEWLTPDEAIAVNEGVLADGKPSPWTARELAVLRFLRDSPLQSS